MNFKLFFLLKYNMKFLLRDDSSFSQNKPKNVKSKRPKDYF